MLYLKTHPKTPVEITTHAVVLSSPACAPGQLPKRLPEQMGSCAQKSRLAPTMLTGVLPAALPAQLNGAGIPDAGLMFLPTFARQPYTPVRTTSQKEPKGSPSCSPGQLPFAMLAAHATPVTQKIFFTPSTLMGLPPFGQSTFVLMTVAVAVPAPVLGAMLETMAGAGATLEVTVGVDVVAVGVTTGETLLVTGTGVVADALLLVLVLLVCTMQPYTPDLTLPQ